jgi:hypothetical protein
MKIITNSELVAIPKLGQTQASLSDQLFDLAYIAERCGFYDAADHLRRSKPKVNQGNPNHVANHEVADRIMDAIKESDGIVVHNHVFSNMPMESGSGFGVEVDGHQYIVLVEQVS